MKNKILSILLLFIFLSVGTSQSAELIGSLLYKIQFEKHSGTPADVVVETDGSSGVYEAFSGRYMKYDPQGRFMDSVQKEGLTGGNCFVKDGKNFLFCNSENASLDLLSEDLEKKASFKLPPDIDGKYDPTDALVKNEYLYSVDNDNHRIIKANLATGNNISSVGGYGQSKLTFWYPYSIAVDSKGIFYISEVMNTRIQKITKKLRFYDFMGNWGIKGGTFYRPTGIALYKNKTLLVADGYTGIIQTLDLDGRFTGVIKDNRENKVELGSITHIRINESILAVVDAFNKSVHIYELKER